MNVNTQKSIEYVPRVLIVDTNVNSDSDYKKIELTLTELFKKYLNSAQIANYEIKKFTEAPELLEGYNVLVCSGKYKNDLFNRGFVNTTEFIVVFCANVEFHRSDPNVLSHSETIKVENNVALVCQHLIKYFENKIEDLNQNKAVYE